MGIDSVQILLKVLELGQNTVTRYIYSQARSWYQDACLTKMRNCGAVRRVISCSGAR